jgi:hypothetical protein
LSQDTVCAEFLEGDAILDLEVSLDAAHCRWSLGINTYCGGGGGGLVWLGYKTTGDTPVGDYERAEGYLGPEKLSINNIEFLPR